MKLKMLLAIPAAASLALAPMAAQATSIAAQPDRMERQNRSGNALSEELQMAVGVFFVFIAITLIALLDEDEDQDQGGGVPVTP